LIDTRVHGMAAKCVQVVVEGLLEMNESALAGAIGPVLKGG
jgi:hypothetical protein